MISLNLLGLLVCLYLALNFENLHKITTVLVTLDQKEDTSICVWIMPVVINVTLFYKLLYWDEIFLVQIQCTACRLFD